MTDLSRRYDITITVDRDGGDHQDPTEFAVAAEQAASARAASIVSAHTANQVICRPVTWSHPTPDGGPSGRLGPCARERGDGLLGAKPRR